MKGESSIERRIIDYLETNPAAQDTLRGIAEWWLREGTSAEISANVLTAVANLVTKGKLIARRRPDGQVHYSGCKTSA